MPTEAPQHVSMADAVAGGFSEIPKTLARARIIEASYGYSSKQKIMTTLGCEVIEPDTKKNAKGQVVQVAGASFKLYLTHDPLDPNGAANCLALAAKLGATLDEPYDGLKVKEYWLGWEFDIVIDSREDFILDEARNPILDRKGQKISNGFRINVFSSAVPANCGPTRVNML